MKTQNIIISHPKSIEQIDAIKAFMKALKIKFEVSKTKESPYNPEFVAKIQKSRKQHENGESIRVKQEDLQNFLGLE